MSQAWLLCSAALHFTFCTDPVFRGFVKHVKRRFVFRHRRLFCPDFGSPFWLILGPHFASFLDPDFESFWVSILMDFWIPILVNFWVSILIDFWIPVFPVITTYISILIRSKWVPKMIQNGDPKSTKNGDPKKSKMGTQKT